MILPADSGIGPLGPGSTCVWWVSEYGVCEVGVHVLYECMVCVWTVCKRVMGVWAAYECGSECHVVEYRALGSDVT